MKITLPIILVIVGYILITYILTTSILLMKKPQLITKRHTLISQVAIAFIPTLSLYAITSLDNYFILWNQNGYIALSCFFIIFISIAIPTLVFYIILFTHRQRNANKISKEIKQKNLEN
ncbi:hypothetical protein [Metamycoplasma hominis]|uniref:hypothetical protein n=1 Tax=Metamycoplasma hominis TaxID=2098 RepID=UPI003CEA1D69